MLPNKVLACLPRESSLFLTCHPCVVLAHLENNRDHDLCVENRAKTRPSNEEITLSVCRSYEMSFLRGRIAYVQQDPFLFAGSYFDNVCYGLDEAEVASVRRQRLVEKVTKIVQMEDFIKRQPNGFNHEVGPKGHALSGGQRQRVALARALLRQPRLLVRILPCLVVYFMLHRVSWLRSEDSSSFIINIYS